MTTNSGDALGSTAVLKKWPVLVRHERAAEWLQVWTDLGRAPRTIDAYARGLAEYLTCASGRASIRSPRIGHTSPSMCVS